jgi:hypothetical protein
VTRLMKIFVYSLSIYRLSVPNIHSKHVSLQVHWQSTYNESKKIFETWCAAKGVICIFNIDINLNFAEKGVLTWLAPSQ